MLGQSNKGENMKLSSVGKFLDQPLLSNTLQRKMPVILTGAALAYGVADTVSQPKSERKNRAIKNATILGSITASTLLGVNFIKVGGEKLIETLPKEEILARQGSVIAKFKTLNPSIDTKVNEILTKAQKKMLNLAETDELLKNIKSKPASDELINSLFGANKNITSKEIFNEISKLSIMGFIPVASGIAGGIAADKLTGESSKEKTTNKIKEGIYQFFANIFLCNVGAGSFLFAAEKLNEKDLIKNFTPLKKTAVILSGILSVGVLGGSFIANKIGNKIVNPIINKFEKKPDSACNKYEQRVPEPLDIALHTDDIATAGVLSGVKWIEPLLPVMYLISGYRSAIGYRNADKLDKAKNHAHNC